MREKQRGVGSTPRWVWGSIAACVVITTGLALTRRASAQRAAHEGLDQLQTQQRLARAEGIPLTEAELSFLAAKPGENAAPLYKKAGAMLDPKSHSNKALGNFVSFFPSDPNSAEPARAFVSAAKPAMDLVERAASMPDCDRGDRFNTALEFPELAQLKFFAKIAQSQAELTASEGDPVRALNVLAKRAPMCGQLAQQPTAIDALVQVAIVAIFDRAVKDILLAHGREPGVAEAASRVLTAYGPLAKPADVVEVENIGLLESMASDLGKPAGASNDQGSDPDIARLLRLAKEPGRLDRWRALEIETTRKLVAASRSYGDNWLSLEKEFDTISEKALKPADENNAYARIIALPFTNFVDQYAVNVSERRVLAQAAAVLEAWSQTGTMPNSLPLSGPAAHDPLAPRDFHFSHTASGFVVYGVGSHGVDHGGLPRQINRPMTGYDIVFKYPPEPPAKRALDQGRLALR